MRILTDHKVNPANDALTVTVVDEPGAGGAHHHYTIVIPHSGEPAHDSPETVHLYFQNGPIKEAGVNGITHEALLAILIDRMRGFQAGPYASRDNACALTKLEEALMWLQKRTLERMRRGVEGTHQK